MELLCHAKIGEIYSIQSSSKQSLEKLLSLIQNTNDKYKKYLTNINNKSSQISINQEIQQKILKCQQEYDKIVLNNVKITSQNNNIVSLNYNMNVIKQIIENTLIQIRTTKYNEQFIKNYANVKFFKPKDDSKLYSICQFDLKYTKLSDGSTIDCDNKHIKIGSMNGDCYSMILADKQHVQGYSSGQHCFRMYYKNPHGSNKWLFFGIYKYGIIPKNVHTYLHETSWGIVDDGHGLIYCNGQCEHDESRMSFLYSLNENQIDMLIDFDTGILSYSIVDDDVKNRNYTYTFKKKFNANIAYTVHLNFLWSGTEVQLAKINVNMFGRNTKLVQWPISKY